MGRAIAVFAAVLFVFTGTALADGITQLIKIQPIQIRSDDGSTAANAGRELFEAEGDKIWRQAGVDLVFLPWTTYDDSSLLSLGTSFGMGTDEFGILAADPTSYGGSADALTINMWFVEDLDGSATFYGIGKINNNGVAIGWDAVAAFNGGIGRLDTMAHELGHNLNLGHNTFGAGAANNLMTSGGSRSVPTSLADIYPDGLGLDFLNAQQIAEAIDSRFTQPVPEPGTVALLALGIAGVVVLRRRKSA